MTGHELSPRRALEPMVLADRLPAAAMPATPPQGTRSLMLWLFFLGVAFFGVLGTWAATASMRSAVIASGLFRVQGENLAVQHLEGGIVHEIAVKEGQIVQ
jgi:multidrug efflux pump subunit AcrA (membrane-fusion protein)